MIVELKWWYLPIVIVIAGAIMSHFYFKNADKSGYLGYGWSAMISLFITGTSILIAVILIIGVFIGKHC